MSELIIVRKVDPRNNKKFLYYKNNNLLTDKNILNKISKIYIAPAYTNVKIYPNSNKLLATGYDTAGRKQYIYSANFKQRREEKKYCQLIKISKMIQRLKAQIDKDILAPYFTRNKLTAVILRIMEVCNFRSGTRKMEKLHGSHGITTIHKKHINIKNDKIEIGFIGKKQVNNHCIINNKKLYDIIKTIYKLSNKGDPYLFSITNEKGEKISITMKDLNDYLKPYEITTKDLRTWNANVIFLKNLKKNIDATFNEYKVLNEKKKDRFRKKIVQESIKTTAELLHHTPTICKSSYLYKKIMEEFLANDKIIHKLNNNSNMNYENELFKLLKEYGKIDGCR